MSDSRPNCAIAKKLYDAFLAGDLTAIYSLLDPNIEWELVGTSEVPHFGLYKGIEDVKRFFSIISEINQVETFEVLSYTETENGAYVECRERGHFKGHPQAFELRSCQILEIENGKIIRFRIYQDTSQMVDAWRS